ncbi:MAG: hypothetical protein IKA78_00060 [Oscillospiraceae bacterium]|nr:hypothetical protein [Oscillospiraceae bacterium]
MKRGLSVFLALIVLLSALPFAASAAKLVGDGNEDYIVNAKDATILRRSLAGGYGVTVDERVSDTNGDGEINAKDVTALRRYLAGGFGTELGTTADARQLYYTGAVTGGQLYADLDEPRFGDVVCGYGLTVLVDGAEDADSAALLKEKIVSGNTEKIIPKGSYTKVTSDPDTMHITVSTVKTLPASYKEITLNLRQDSKYRLLGRAEQLSDGVRCDWSADGVEFTADCGGLIRLTASVNHEYWRNHLRFRVIVDGVLSDPIQFEETNGEARTLTASLLVQPGKHTVRIIKDTSGDYADDRLISVTFSGKADTVAPTEPRPKLLEVIGASTATGAGILPTPDDGESVGTNNTATIAQTFGYLVAEELNMDITTVVKGSLGIVVKAGSPKFNLPELYEYQNRYRDATSVKNGERTEDPELYGFARKADAVILMINENDAKIPSEEWTPATKAFISRIREINGADCKILFLYYGGSKHKTDIAQILEDDPDLIGLGIRSNDQGSGGHANAAAHRGWADKIIPLLQPFV